MSLSKIAKFDFTDQADSTQIQYQENIEDPDTCFESVEVSGEFDLLNLWKFEKQA